MELLRSLHGYQFNSALAVFFPTPYALVTLILFVWSLAPAIKGTVSRSFLVWLRVTWALTLLPAATGVILALGGAKVPSATDLGRGVTKYGYAVDPSRDWEHWMYAAFSLLTLYGIEVLMLIRSRLVAAELDHSGVQDVPAHGVAEQGAVAAHEQGAVAAHEQGAEAAHEQGLLVRLVALLTPERLILLLLPVATLFLYGCAYMIGRVAIFPGSTPGT